MVFWPFLFGCLSSSNILKMSQKYGNMQYCLFYFIPQNLLTGHILLKRSDTCISHGTKNCVCDTKELLEITKNNIWYATVFFQNIILYLPGSFFAWGNCQFKWRIITPLVSSYDRLQYTLLNAALYLFQVNRTSLWDVEVLRPSKMDL